MSGYNENFLDGHILPLPTYSTTLTSEIYKSSKLRDSEIADYVHYSVVMNKHETKRSPAFVAFNIDQNKLKKTNRYNNWRTDKNIKKDIQLDNAYYKHNPWDKGHMARRHTAGWGDTIQEAQRAANETFYYTNACLQHANLNQDEWLALEDWVYDLDLDKDGKITSIMGPFYTEFDRSIQPDGKPLALVPTGFFKIICFINKDTQKLDVRAFVMYQDVDALRDKKGRMRFNNQTYQTTVTRIEQLTGLQFDDAVYEANPLLNNPDELDDGNGVPEEFEVGCSVDILHKVSERQTIHDDIIDIFIAAAMVNPESSDRGNEWISLTNFSADDIDLSDWTLEDNSGKSLTLNSNVLSQTVIKSGESVVINQIQPLRLGNKGDVIKLFDNQNNRIDWVNYTQRMVNSG